MEKAKLIKMTKELCLLEETLSQLSKVGMLVDFGEEQKEVTLTVSKLRELLGRKKIQLINNLK
jgi:hypothetical protein